MLAYNNETGINNEVEKKFLLDFNKFFEEVFHSDFATLKKCSKVKHIDRLYLERGKHNEIRIDRTYKENTPTYKMTVKSVEKTDGGRDEFEMEIFNTKVGRLFGNAEFDGSIITKDKITCDIVFVVFRNGKFTYIPDLPMEMTDVTSTVKLKVEISLVDNSWIYAEIEFADENEIEENIITNIPGFIRDVSDDSAYSMSSYFYNKFKLNVSGKKYYPRSLKSLTMASIGIPEITVEKLIIKDSESNDLFRQALNTMK